MKESCATCAHNKGIEGVASLALDGKSRTTRRCLACHLVGYVDLWGPGDERKSKCAAFKPTKTE